MFQCYNYKYCMFYDSLTDHFVVKKKKTAVVAFAGDALICAFPGTAPSFSSSPNEPNNINGECCLRALLCACELSKYENKNLSTHIGVTFGEMNFAMLGGLNKQWVYVLAGDCVSELAKCINDAGPKEVVCTKEIQ